MEYLENKIKEAIGPFVKNILDVNPGTHKEENGEDFFKGHYDGTWRVKVCPILHKQVSNYIVVDNKYQVGPRQCTLNKLVTSLRCVPTASQLSIIREPLNVVVL